MHRLHAFLHVKLNLSSAGPFFQPCKVTAEQDCSNIRCVHKELLRCCVEQDVSAMQGLKERLAINLQAEVSKIPSDIHLYWYTAERGVNFSAFTPSVHALLYS